MIRFAIWTAVSTPEQAKKGKDSLPEQERAARKAGTSKGWHDTALVYSVPGASRSRYVNLSDAERNIPQLRKMLEDAKAGRYDILILWDYNRLRDLLDPVAKSLAQYKVQIFSVNQPIEPAAPEEFQEYTSDSEFMMRNMNRMISHWQLADLRRKYNYGMRGRLERGLNPIGIPYGYIRKGDKDTIPEPYPPHARLVIEIKERFLRGESYEKIIAALSPHPTPSGKEQAWSYTTIKKILSDPFYAGKVTFRKRLTLRDARLDKKRIIKNPTPIINDGAHTPLYPWEDYLKIQQELSIRAAHPSVISYPYSGILYCASCQHRLRRVDANGYTCKRCHTVHIKDHQLIDIIPTAIQDGLRNHDIKKKSPASLPARSDSAIKELERQRQRIHTGFESGIYNATEAKTKIQAIEKQIAALRDDEIQTTRTRLQAEQFQLTLQELRSILHHLPQWFADEDPKIVNGFLHRLCTHIYITPDNKATPKFRSP